MSDEHWSQTFEHDSLADTQARESFTKAMSKYDSPEAAVVGGFNAMKLAGKPYKLPESVDKLPEEVRGEFTTNAKKVLGLVGATEDDFKDFAFNKGLPEGVPVDEGMVNSFKQFVTENGVTKAGAEKLVEFHNKAVAAAMQKIEGQKKEAMKTTNEALIKHFGSEDKVKERSQLVKQFYQNHAGLSADEFEQVGHEIESIISRNPILARVHLEKIADLAAEASTESGDSQKGQSQPSSLQKENKELAESPTGKALGWDK